MGADLHFRPGKGPQIDNPVRNREDVKKLKDFVTTRDLPAVLEAIQICNEKASVPILVLPVLHSQWPATSSKEEDLEIG